MAVAGYDVGRQGAALPKRLERPVAVNAGVCHVMHLDGAKGLLLYWPEHEREGSAFNVVNDYKRIVHHFVMARPVDHA